MSVKQKRIASDMMRVIGEVLLEEARDDLLKQITITGVEVASDLSYAKVYFTSLITALSHQDLEREMEEAAPFIRNQLAAKMNLRNTPKLKFLYDNSIEIANNIENIIKEIHKNEEDYKL